MSTSTKEVVEGERLSEKKTRKRKKKLFKDILQQMEFYFSDANLNKDRFLHKLMCESDDGRVDLRVFLKFKKILAMTDDVNHILQALSSSEILQVIEDKFVIRKTPVQIKEDVDECTIYVEGLPPQADHDWLRKIFASFGKITYVSLPRFKWTDKLKGFAFLEFETAEEAALACQYYNSTVATASTLPVPQKEPPSEPQVTKSEPAPELVQDDPVVEPSKKRQKLDETVPEHSMTIPAPEVKESLPKKQRKRKKKTKDKEEVETPHLRVIPKLEWKRLKNIYMNLQRANMAAVKKSLGIIPNSRDEQRQDKSPAIVTEEVPSTPKLPEFTMGVIVRFETKEPVASAKAFRGELKDYAGVLYVDLKDGQTFGHIRCDEPDNARKLLSEMKSKHSAASILEGEDETDYWRRITSEREAKVNSKSKTKPVRGKDKVYAKAVQLSQKSNLHIRFDD